MRDVEKYDLHVKVVIVRVSYESGKRLDIGI